MTFLKDWTTALRFGWDDKGISKIKEQNAKLWNCCTKLMNNEFRMMKGPGTDFQGTMRLCFGEIGLEWPVECVVMLYVRSGSAVYLNYE